MKSWEDLKQELALIKSNIIQEWTLETLKNAPTYFYVAQASSSGKYHPKCTIKEGGLITHIKRVVYLANHICEACDVQGLARDTVISACILHDIAKTPSERVAHIYGMTTTNKDFVNHPINAEKYFAKNCELNKEPEQVTINMIQILIAYHMGRWTPESIKKDIVDYSLCELIVYLSDYLASRKDLITPKDNG